VATLSTGPVAPADKINHTNAALIARYTYTNLLICRDFRLRGNLVHDYCVSPKGGRETIGLFAREIIHFVSSALSLRFVQLSSCAVTVAIAGPFYSESPVGQGFVSPSKTTVQTRNSKPHRTC
jgi:hypothetical protein